MLREEIVSDLEINRESVDIFSPELVRLDTGYVNVKKGSDITFSAPHQMTQIREGSLKQGEPGTAYLAFYLASKTGGSAIGTIGEQTSDPNYVFGHPYIDVASKLSSGGMLIDLHMMKPRGFEICLGLGPDNRLSKHLREVCIEEFLDAGVKIALNYPFASKGNTVTSQLQRKGIPAIQIEMDYEVFNREDQRYNLVMSSLVNIGNKLRSEIL